MGLCDPKLHNGEEVPADFLCFPVVGGDKLTDHLTEHAFEVDGYYTPVSLDGRFASCAAHLGHAVSTVMRNEGVTSVRVRKE